MFRFLIIFSYFYLLNPFLHFTFKSISNPPFFETIIDDVISILFKRFYHVVYLNLLKLKYSNCNSHTLTSNSIRLSIRIAVQITIANILEKHFLLLKFKKTPKKNCLDIFCRFLLWMHFDLCLRFSGRGGAECYGEL